MKNGLTFVVALAIVACGGAPDTAWHSEAGYRWRSLDVPRRGTPGFTLIDSARSGVAFVNTVSESLLVRNRILAQGAGVCLGDVDGDGLPDMFLARTEGSSRLYRNLGEFRFEDITERAGTATADRHATGCAFADVNGDRSQDLIVAALGGPNTLYLNDGHGVFNGRTIDSGPPSSAGSTTIAVADADGDGWLDIYIANYKAYTTLDRISPQERSFDQVVRQTGPRRFEVREPYRADYKVDEREDLGGINLSQRADPDFFYRGLGGGRFIREPIAGSKRFLDEQGQPLKAEPEDFGLAATFADLDGDGAPELYVANDFEDPDRFWKNDGHGHFRLVPWFVTRATSNSGMAVAVGDVNRDGLPDLFEVDMLSQDTRRLKTQIPTHTALPKMPGVGEGRPQMQRNTLQLNRGDGTFGEIARFAGIGASGWSWSTLFLDVDLDGWEDILIGTGHRWDVMDGTTQYRLRNRLNQIDWRRMLFEYPPLPLPNVAFRNRGDLTFEDASRSWRFDLGEDISHGMAVADLDGDGDLDVVINRLGKPAAVLRNDATAPRVAVRLKSETPNTSGIGSRVRMVGGGAPIQQREIVAGGLYLSSSDATVTFASGQATDFAIEIDWRDGRRTAIADARPGRLYEISDSSAAKPALAAKGADTVVTPLFEDASDQLNGHRHVEPYFDDYARQLLLPNAFSQLGPGVAWFDVDDDGDEDLLVGAGRTGTLAWFRNERGRLRRNAAPFAPAHVDLTTVLGWPDGRGGRMVIAGASSYEMGTLADALRVPSVIGYSPTTRAMTELVPGDSASAGPLALADVDGDGRLDLFVGGRVVPRGYPLAPSSRLFRNEGGRLVPDAANNQLFAGLGMVSSATFADINGDGWPDLIVAIEWGPVRVFLNDRGRFQSTQMPGLSGLTSRWNGIATGDLDGDGRLDIVATSWGRNTEQHASPRRPIFLYTFFADRGADVMLAQEDPRIGAVAPLTTFGRFGLALPASALWMRTFDAFADASIVKALGPRASRSLPLASESMDHMLFSNRGNHFVAGALPADAQLAPAFYAGVADFNGDGNEDVILSQNFFATEVATARYDAGRGLLLVGDGTGALHPMPGQSSGVMVYGEQRGAAYADFDADGRLDLVISQNGAATRLFRNVGAAAGLRVRLVGPLGNPSVVGAQMRLRYGERSGPVREVQAGSGYWSQNGAVQVLGRVGSPTGLWIRWPGGREQVVPLTADQKEVTARAP